jgi:hypothetical protein
MKSLSNGALLVIGCLVVVAAVSPALISLSSALVPLVVAVGVAFTIVRLVFVHTRRW